MRNCILDLTFIADWGNNMKNIILLLLVAIVLLSACDTVWDETFVPPSELPDEEGFYTTAVGDFVLKYKVMESQQLLCRLSANSDGWVAIGFAPSAQMKDANFITGYHAGIYGYIRDDFGVDNTSHAADVSLGGSSDVTLLSSSNSEGRTTLEFELPLASGDEYDRTMTVGSTYPVIFASGSADDFDSYHNRYATGSIKPR